MIYKQTRRQIHKIHVISAITENYLCSGRIECTTHAHTLVVYHGYGAISKQPAGRRRRKWRRVCPVLWVHSYNSRELRHRRRLLLGLRFIYKYLFFIEYNLYNFTNVKFVSNKSLPTKLAYFYFYMLRNKYIVNIFFAFLW